MKALSVSIVDMAVLRAWRCDYSLVVLAMDIEGCLAFGRTESCSPLGCVLSICWVVVWFSVGCGGGMTWMSAELASLGTLASGRFAACNPFFTSCVYVPGLPILARWALTATRTLKERSLGRFIICFEATSFTTASAALSAIVL